MPIRLIIAGLIAHIAVLAAVSPAHAQQSQPGLFDSLGKLLAPKAPAATPVASGSRTLAVTAPGQGRRIALVIGNGDYQNPDNLPKLANPTHDAEDIAEALRGFGFEVIERKNQTLEGMSQAVAEFGSKIGGSEAALFYFAGHGIQVKNQNYLMPVSAKIESEAAVPFQGFNVNQILEEMDNGKSGANIVMLDACRNNPISGKFRSGGTRGLASPGNAPQGTVIVYATDPGNVAADGEGRNGMFTAGLLTAFKGGDLSLDGVLTVASEYVEKKSLESDPTRKQTPYVNGPKTLQKNFHFRAGQGTQLAQLSPQISRSRTREQIEDELWDAIKGSEKPSVFEAYQREYPNGRYLAQAKVKLAGLKDAARPVAEPPKVAVSPAPSFTAAGSDPETALWSEVQKGNTADDYDVYLKQYPKGRYVGLAKQRLQKLKDEARQQAEAAEHGAWQAAESAQTPEGYVAYLASYPSGRYSALAKSRSSKLKQDAAAQEESRLWQDAEKGGKAEVDAYLGRYPSGRYAAIAQLKRTQIRKEEAAGPHPGQTFKDCGDCPEMVVIPAGSFEMGSNENFTRDAKLDKWYKPVHAVRIGKPFALGKTEVTQGQWNAVMGNNPSHFSSCGDRCPVEQANWNDAKAFIQKLNAKTGKTYRLPSEAEWEYACRAGGSHRYCGSENIDSVTWHALNSDGKTHVVAGLQANAWGLYDMSGNVWEWTEDCWNANYNGAPTDGSAWTSGDCGRRVIRGSSWGDMPQGIRSADRYHNGTTGRHKINGFRLVRMLP